MTILINKRKYKIGFQYDKTLHGNVAMCIVNYNKKTMVTLSEGSRLEKIKLRKESFTKAINKLFPGIEFREERKTAWGQFSKQIKLV